MASLLAVDVGVRSGLALFGEDGQLRWQRSQNFGSVTRLRQAIPALLRSIPDLVQIVLEGGGACADPWVQEATRRDIAVRMISAETWRQALLYEREQRSGEIAKQHALELAYGVLRRSTTKIRIPHTLRHDAAEAILCGLWGTIELGWNDTSILRHKTV